MALPGLVGSGATWRRACRLAEASYERGEWLALEGEPGVGKLALVRAVHQRRNPAAPCHVLDAADAAHDHDWLTQVRAELLEGTGMLVCGTCTAQRAPGADAGGRVAGGEGRRRGRGVSLPRRDARTACGSRSPSTAPPPGPT